MTYPAVPLTNPWVTGYVNAVTMYDNTTLPLNEIQAVFVNQGAGSVGHVVLGSTATVTTNVVLITVNVSVVAGRKYWVAAGYSGSQNTSTSVVTVPLFINSGQVTYLSFNSYTPQTLYATAGYFYTPGTTGTFAFQINASSSAGTLTVNAGAFLVVIDLGTV